MSDIPKDYPERAECDFDTPISPLDQRVREGEGVQYELFPEYGEEQESRKARIWERFKKSCDELIEALIELD